MNNEPPRTNFKAVLEGSYYTFVVAVIGLLILFATNYDEYYLRYILFGVLLVSAFILTAYLTYKIIKHNAIVGKQSPFGVIFISIGLFLIIFKMATIIAGEYTYTNYFGYIGLASVIIGIFFEVTMIDEITLKLTKNVLIALKDLAVLAYKVLLRYKILVLKLTYDFLAFVGCVLVGVFWNKLPLWAVIIIPILLISGIIAIHFKEIKSFTIFYYKYILKPAYIIIKEITKGLFKIMRYLTIELLKWLKDLAIRLLHKILSLEFLKQLGFEILRLIGAGLGVAAILFATKYNGLYITFSQWESGLLIAAGVMMIIISELLSRHIILLWLPKLYKFFDLVMRTCFIFGLVVLPSFVIKRGYKWDIGFATLELLFIFLFLWGLDIFSIKKMRWHFRHYIGYMRFIGFYFGVTGSVMLGVEGYSVKWLVITVVGYFVLFFAKQIIRPSLFIPFFKSLWNFTKNFVRYTWLFIKNFGRYFWSFIKALAKFFYRTVINFGRFLYKLLKFAYRNILLTLLFLFGTFTMIYGISLLVNFDFLHILKDASYTVYASMGIGFITVSIASFILFGHEVRKLARRKVQSAVSRLLGGNER